MVSGVYLGIESVFHDFIFKKSITFIPWLFSIEIVNEMEVITES